MSAPVSETSPAREDAHRRRMQRKKALLDQALARADATRGLVLVHTGNGKGKSTAAFGLLARALGHGLRAEVVQFVKNRSDTGEEAFFRRQAGVAWHVMGAGFTWETQDDARDRAAALAAWAVACRALTDAGVNLLILDEFTYALKYRWLALDDVLRGLAGRPPMQHVVITGRAAPPGLLAAADTVTEMKLVRHAFQAGVRAMPGIEF